MHVFSGRFFVAAVTLAVVAVVPACTSLERPVPQPAATPARPAWNQQELRQHLQFFNGVETAGRAAGTPGYVTAAAYVASRMKEFGLQPVHGDSYQFVHRAAANYALSATLVAGLRDTLAFVLGLDILPDGYSDAGSMRIRELAYSSGENQPWVEGRAALVAAEQATPAYLRHLRETGAQAVLVVGELTPRMASAPIPGLLVVQVVPAVAAEVLGLRVEALERRLGEEGTVLWQLPRPLRLRVEAEFRPWSDIVNVLGYLPGKQPVRANELIIVCADLDAFGRFSGADVFDFGHFGVGVAALLEVARSYGTFSNWWPVPGRTILFAAWSGGLIGAAGLRAYLRNPAWVLEQTVAVIYVGPGDDEVPGVKEAVAAARLPLYVVPLPERPPSLQRPVIRPSAASLRAAARKGVDAPAPSQMLDWGVAAATTLADEVSRLLLREAVTPAPWAPVSADTLATPASAEQ